MNLNSAWKAAAKKHRRRCLGWNDLWFWAMIEWQTEKRKLQQICARIYERHIDECHNADFEVCKDPMCAMVRELDFDTALKEK